MNQTQRCLVAFSKLSNCPRIGRIKKVKTSRIQSEFEYNYHLCKITKFDESNSGTILKDTLLNAKVREKLEELIMRHNVLLKEFDRLASNFQDSDAYTKKSKELSDVGDIALPYKELKKAEYVLRCNLAHFNLDLWLIYGSFFVIIHWSLKELTEILQMIAESENDQDLRLMAQEEYTNTVKRILDIERKIVSALLPKDNADQGNAILEVRAGTGGDEAALFGNEMLRMYERYAVLRKWQFEILSVSEESSGGIKEASVSINGSGVFGNLRYESGVHRVQRIPATENQGRVHTSTITVAILPEPTEVDVNIKESDLRIDIYRASGKGGQHVNKTESAVRLTHIPTGLVVAIQDERSQPKNKAKALKILQARLYDLERKKLQTERTDARRQQIGTAERSEKIRTYNFPQNRVTDHRLNLTLHELENVMNGISLQTIIDKCKLYFETEALARSV
ncbi:hypothetical protein G9A89_021940 [Geosiphon pyriformis]|nr:hypothetical protein G9A89_021940 [Geosiphon pyriformis]